MKKLFISQPMANLTEQQIRDARNQAVKEIKTLYGDEEIEVIDSIFTEETDGKAPIWFLGKSIELLADADICIFLKGWEDARGCRVEHLVAEEYGVEFIHFPVPLTGKIGFRQSNN